MIENTVAQREWIPQIIRRYKIKTVADIGAGDLNWMRQVKLPKGVDYTAYDLIPRAPEVQAFNILDQVPPAVDLLMCLWLLNHMPFEQCKKALLNIKASGAKYLMMTDRVAWHKTQPPEIVMPFIEELKVDDLGDRILLIDLNV